jgi:hypothetical protein
MGRESLIPLDCIIAFLAVIHSDGFGAEAISWEREARRYLTADIVITGSLISDSTMSVREEWTPGPDGSRYLDRAFMDIYRVEVDTVLKGDFSDSVVVLESRPYSRTENHMFDRVDERGDSIFVAEVVLLWGGIPGKISGTAKYIILIEKQDNAYVSMFSRRHSQATMDFFRQFQNTVLDFELLYEGSLQVPGSCSRVQAVKLLGKQREYMALETTGEVGLYEFAGDNWKLLTTVPLVAGDVAAPNTPWAVGDMDNDGGDEIVVVVDSSLRCYAWSAEGMNQMSYRLPGLVDDFLIGDVDNDGRNELVSLCYDRPLLWDESGCLYSVWVASLEDDRLTMVWTDRGVLGYRKSNITPSDNLVCIGDIVNIGSNQLVLAEGQSDVSPTRYHLLSWMENELKLIKTFIVSGARIISEGHEEKTPFMISDISSLRIDDRTVLLSTMVYENVSHMPAVVIIEDEVFTQLGVIPMEEPVRPNRVCCIHLGERRPGILGISSSKKEPCTFVYYEIVPPRGKFVW